MMNEQIKNNGKINIDIEVSNPCVHCSGDCDSCPFWVDDVDYASVASEAESFRLSLSVDVRKTDHIKISI